MIYGPDGQPLSRENPFKQKTLDEMPVLSQEEMEHLYGVCQSLIDQKVPPTLPAAVPTEGLIRLVKTLKHYADIVNSSEE
jgi:hypothetical protein